MFERLRELSDLTFRAHGHGYFWTSELIWLHVVSDALIGLSYVVISATLAYLVYRIRRLPFHGMFLAFGLFLIACSATHFMDILVIWKAHYWWQGFVKALTAVASLGTALLLLRLVPRALALVRSAELSEERHGELKTRNQELEALYENALEARKRELQGAVETMHAARDQAAQASLVKNHFLSLVSHELRTPLTAINLYLQSLERDREGSLSARQGEMLRRIAGSSRRLLELIDTLLEYSQLQRGRLAMQVEAFHLATVAGEVVETLAVLAEHKQLPLRLEAVPALPPLCSDPRLVRLILTNLVDNALKYTVHGEVRVTLAHADETHRLAVHDTGPGIPPEKQNVIFEPFEHLEPVRHKHTPGVGLGLALVKEMVHMLGGRIELQSQVGAGSTFTVLLPPVPEPRGDEGGGPADHGLG
jgi:signal transduction histidine kinase